jgi:hypothetical protein
MIRESLQSREGKIFFFGYNDHYLKAGMEEKSLNLWVKIWKTIRF